MTNKIKSIPCKVDALSLTWSPQELLGLKHLAKIGACLKTGLVIDARHNSLNRHLHSLEAKKNSEFSQIPAFDSVAYGNVLNRYKDNCQEITREFNNRRYKDLDIKSMSLAENEVAARYELRDMLKGEFDVDTTISNNKRLDNLLDNIGIDLLDILCCGEVERFVCRLNNVFTEESYMWTVKNNPAGRFNYQYSANLYADGEQAGIIAWGGRNLGCYVSFMGAGCNALDMPRLYREIHKIPSMKITRIDLAHDDMEGKYSVDVARKMAKKGGFCAGGRPSSYMYIESGHLKSKQDKQLIKEHFKSSKKSDSKTTIKKAYRFIPDKGRSLYIGSRESGKLLRVYEKGIQMGDPNDKWVRWEVELHSKQRIIPLDAMIKPSEYLAGAYPALSFLNEEQSVIKTIVKTASMTIDRIIENQVISTRKAINMMRVLCGFNDSKIIDTFLKGIVDPFSKASMPQRLKISITEELFLEQLSEELLAT